MSSHKFLLALLFVGLAGIGLWRLLALPDLPAPSDSTAVQALLRTESEPPPRVPTPSPGQPILVRSGFLHYGFEWLYFTPCRSNSRYWLEGTDSSGLASLLARFPSATETDRVLFLRGCFYISPPGAYGHLGQYSRLAVFTRVDELRPTQPADCYRTQ